MAAPAAASPPALELRYPAAPVTGRQWVAVGLIVLAGLAIIGGVLYVVEPAKSLPSVMPGHVSGLTAHRWHRGVAAFVLALILLVIAYFVARPSPQQPAV